MLAKAQTKSEFAVRTIELWKTYNIGPIEYTALRGVTVSIRRGEFVAVVGPSGSGKSTFLNVVGTLDVPTKGEVLLDGVPTSQIRGNALAALRNSKLGFVFQSYNLINYLTARENVELPLVARGMPPSDRRRKAEELLENLGMGSKVNKKPNQLSGGEQQRVAIARALANSPPVILADEPTGNLDSKTSNVVAELLSDISKKRGVTIVVVTHNMELTQFTDRIIHLRDGLVEREVAR